MGTITVKATDQAGHASTITVESVITQPPVTTSIMMGCSNSVNEHGDTEVWEGWRAYTSSSLLSLANRTGTQRPKFIAYSKTGANLGGTNPVYSTVYNEVLADLNNFYYGGTGNTHSARWGIELYWSNGNENHDKGALSIASTAGPNPHSTAQINAYKTSMQALYDACHLTVGGVRRFPDAYAGSDPTTEAERNGWVEDWLHPSAQYHDFVMWSIYPAGRKDTEADPTFNWASTVDADWDNSPDGYMVRCFRRTAAAAAVAGHPIALGVGETGTGDDPGDSTTRPYWAVHGFMQPLMKLSTQYGVEVPFACWWDNQTDVSSPQNILSTGSPAWADGATIVGEPASTNPSTRQAWQNHLQYNHLRGGTHPASWAGNPKAGWKTTGTVQ